MSRLRNCTAALAASLALIGGIAFTAGPAAAAAPGNDTQAGAVTERRNGTTRLDLAGTIRAELRALGIRRVDDTGLCTACESGRFFSFRRDEVTGRQAGVAVKLSA